MMFLGLLPIFLGLGLVFGIALIASIILTHLSGSGQILKISLADLDGKQPKPGQLLDITAKVVLIKFEGLDTYSTLILTENDFMIQASDPDGKLINEGAESTSILPGDPASFTGKEQELGNFRLIGVLEDLPVRHFKIKAVERN